MSSPFNRIGFSPNCKDFLPPNPAAWPCALLISILYCLSSSRGKKPCLPPRGVASINKLQSTPKKMDEISSDSLKYCHDHEHHFQMPRFRGQESRSGNLIYASHMQGYCQAKELHFDI